jgi:uncharacterized protein (TIGR03083 family)
MDLDAYVAALTVAGERLAAAAQSAGLDAPVAPCPDWSVRDLVTHVGGVHRWAASIVGNAMPANDEVTGDQVGSGPADDTLLDWFREGHVALVETLVHAPADLECFTFLPAPTPLLFWARRQAHETAIHAIDAQCAHGSAVAASAVTLDPAFAADGIEEILLGFAARPRPAMEPGRLRLEAVDVGAAWTATFGAHGVTIEPQAAVTVAVARESDAVVEPADAVVSGSAADVYRWLWNRPSAAALTGAADVAARWRQIRVRWS